MKKYIILLAAAAMVLGACTKREFTYQPQQGEVKMATLTCSLPVDETKATLNGQGKVAWSEGDSIVVWNYINGTKGESSAKIYKLVSGAGTATGVFQGEAFDKGVARVAMYPVYYSEGVTFQSGSSNRVYYHIPATTEMKTADDTQETGALLCAYIADQTKPFFFEHAGAVLRLQFKDIPASARKIKLYQPKVDVSVASNIKTYSLCGTRYFSATLMKGAGSNPRIGNTGGTSTSAGHVNVSLAFPGGKEGPGLVSGKGVFYFHIPVLSSTTKRDLRFSFLDANDVVIEGTTRDFTVDSLKAGYLVSKPEIAAWIIPEDKGKGTEAEPYLIYNKEDLCKMGSQVVADSVTYFKMMDDVDMTGVKDYLGPNQDSPYTKMVNFDGNNHVISNFTPNTSGKYLGLVGVLVGKVANVTFKNANIESNKNVGIVCGYAGTSSTKPAIVDNVKIINGTITQTGKAHSGLVFGQIGNVVSACSFTNISATGTINQNGQGYSGLIGGAENKPSVYTNCHVEGTINQPSNITTTDNKKLASGGIVGYCSNSTITNCSVSNSSFNTARLCGGIAGFNYTAGVTIKQCSIEAKFDIKKVAKGTSSDVACSSEVAAGIVGYLTGGTIEDCITKGEIKVLDQTAAGIAANVKGSSTIKNCISFISISENRNHGGIVAKASSDSWSTTAAKCLEISGCIYWGTKIDCAKATSANGSSGSIIGFGTVNNVVKDCWRINDSKFTFVNTANTDVYPVDQPNNVPGTSEVWTAGTTPQIGITSTTCPYWGKAASADATASSVATTLGWDTTIWDLSGDEPKLK